MFDYATVIRTVDNKYATVQYKNGYEWYTYSPYVSVVWAINFARAINEKTVIQDRTLMNLAQESISDRDAKVWARLDAWQKAQGWVYIFRNMPEVPHSEAEYMKSFSEEEICKQFAVSGYRIFKIFKI